MVVKHIVVVILVFVATLASCQSRIIRVKRDAELQSRLYNSDLNVFIKGLLVKIDECLQPLWKSFKQAKIQDRPVIKQKIQNLIRRRMIVEKPRKPNEPKKPGKESNTEKPLNIEDEGNNTSSSNSSSSSESISDISSDSSSESYEDYPASTPTQEDKDEDYDAEIHGGGKGKDETAEETPEKEGFFDVDPEKEDPVRKSQEDGVTEAV